MNYEKACKTLDLPIKNDFTIEQLKRQYRAKALMYHPDKNPEANASSQFQIINESYEYLMKYQGYMDSDSDEEDYINQDTDSSNKNNYRWVLFSFFKNILNSESRNTLFYTILQRVVTSCESTALDTLTKLDKSLLIKIYEILKKNKDVLHFTEEFIIKIENMITTRVKNDECIILNPTLHDLFENNLYKLKVNDLLYVIPLWHHELLYDNSGNDMYVKSIPILPENIDIDDKNNIHMDITLNISDIWGKDSVDVFIDNKTFKIKPEILKLIPQQSILFSKQGISRINTANIYDISIKSDVHIHILLSQ